MVFAERIRIRPMTEEDFPLLLRWLTDERLLEFYDGRDKKHTMESIRADYSEQWTEELYRVIVEYDGEAVGYAQIFRLDEALAEEYHHPVCGGSVYAMDLFIGEVSRWNCGIGSAVCRRICRDFRDRKSADAVVLDPRRNNPRAIRAYEKAGFVIIAELPAHEVHEGKREDCVLMRWTPENGEGGECTV